MLLVLFDRVLRLNRCVEADVGDGAQVRDLPAAALVASGTVPEVADHIGRLEEAGRALVVRANGHRRALDQAYGQG